MLISCRATSLVFEAAEAEGIARDDLVRPLGLDARPLSQISGTVSWDVLVDIMEELHKQVGGDVERLRRIGMRMPTAPAYAILRALARTVLSLRALYAVSAKWMAPAMFPHIVQLQSHEGRRLRVHWEIPPPYAPSETFFYIAEGVMASVPELLGLPRAEIEQARVTGRTFDMVLLLPESRSVRELAESTVRAALTRRDVRLLERQRQTQLETLRALQRSHDELRALLDNLPNMACVHAGGRILWVNRLLVTTLGYRDARELVGRAVTDVGCPEPTAGLDITAAVATGPGDFLVFRLRGRDGSSVLAEFAPEQAVVFGGVDARLVVGRDVTERVRMQQQLVTADRLASLGMLAAGVAHEVNNPLSYVLNSIESATRQLERLGAVTEVPREALGTALDGVDRIRFIVRELLVLARGDSGRMGPTDVTAAVESTLALARSEISRSARLVCELEPTPVVLANTARVSQVVLNLVLNALQAMGGRPPSESVLTVRSGVEGSAWVFVDVTDTGVGIAPEALARVFDPFYSTKPAGQGTGLGLAISQRLVVELGGEITIDSVVGKGTTFRVRLPLAPAGSRHALGSGEAPNDAALGRTR